MKEELHRAQPLDGLIERSSHEEVQDETQHYQNQSHNLRIVDYPLECFIAVAVSLLKLDGLGLLESLDIEQFPRFTFENSCINSIGHVHSELVLPFVRRNLLRIGKVNGDLQLILDETCCFPRFVSSQG